MNKAYFSMKKNLCRHSGIDANIISTIVSAEVTDIRNKTVDQLKSLKDMGLREISLGVESGDDWTLDRVNKGYHAEDINEISTKKGYPQVSFFVVSPKGVSGRCADAHSPPSFAGSFSLLGPSTTRTSTGRSRLRRCPFGFDSLRSCATPTKKGYPTGILFSWYRLRESNP